MKEPLIWSNLFIRKKIELILFTVSALFRITIKRKAPFLD
uniref:Uncharacterized protein n=1 Tax=Utricularia reniformis TaxID=192314 RepID=A0A1Y0AZA6_9LAMI|nr:hypothetical protein AEK19_MT0193 [Utricularia reniformis]ART30473.1 hypothetical protein AEK19_MT0193 [Utricularia reniformis]